MLALSPARLFTGEDIIEGATLHIHDGRITDVSTKPSPGAVELDGLMAPGFIDIQINGGGGVLFNDNPCVETLEKIAAAHRRFGVTSFLATLISDERSKMARAIAVVEDAISAGVEGVLGLHLEGPWLAAPRRGVHPGQFLRDFDNEDLALLACKRGFPLLVTVAPERIDAERLSAMCAAGVVVSLGHTAASSEATAAALSCGASGFTHLFNAMPPLEGRQPGPLGAALADGACWAGLILDGIHVHPLSALLALRCKSARKLMLVSDAMATVGSPDPSMSLFGEPIRVEAGALRTASGTLAGAHLDLSRAVRNAVAMLGARPSEALRMASLTPAEFLGVAHERGRIAPGGRADLVLLNAGLEVSAVWIGGAQVH